MQPCEACKALSGKPSSTPPHGDLSALDSDATARAAHPGKRYDEYACTVCGNYLLRNTRDGEPPGVWSLQRA